ncbi:hypothetical protein [Acanthopleuribacter pedis]|uniref:Uncharacterized protein n=1 Tax=Acanthopleuribacter pedis TaxID=442870 RepID=A0A8J7U4B7_9BACT|nr:hypothetical protein [Acanthopleuribacter pedis]MBO1319258.1 hypothetical protein [Acanthopleuribacter pedis]
MQQQRIAAFKENLCLEHLEEASFLFDQRIALTWDLEFTWPEQAAQEEKFATHLDALCSIGQAAWDVMRESAAPTDSGELYTAVVFFCRKDSAKDVAELIPVVDYEEPTVTEALHSALMQHCPNAWVEDLAAWAQETEAFQPIFYEIAARRGWRKYYDARPLRDRGQWPAYARCTLRTNAQAAAPELLDAYTWSKDFDTRFYAALTMMRAAHQPFLRGVMENTAPDDAGLLTLALMGSAQTAGFLLNLPRAKEPSRAFITALALLGDPIACPWLIAQLEEDNEWAPDAALALNTILGGFFTETVWIEEEEDEDELIEEDDEDDEDDDFEPSERLITPLEDDDDDDEEEEEEEEDDPDEDPNQAPQGEEIERLSQDPAIWRQHLEQLKPENNVRYRYGSPATLQSVVGSLFEARTPNFMRDLILHECLTRYNLEIPITVLTPINHQIAVGRKLLAQLEEQGNQLPPGSWTYLGNPYT